MTYDELAPLLRGKHRADAICPVCTPYRKAIHRREKKLRIWRLREGVISYYCIHCEEVDVLFEHDRYRRPDEEFAREWDREGYWREISKQQKAATERDQAERTEKARKLWARGVPIRDTWAERYLVIERNLVPPAEAWSMRFLADCPFPQGSPGPALLVGFYLVSALAHLTTAALPIAIHRIRGRGHANKAMLGPVRKAAMMIDPPEAVKGVLNVCEGLEDGLAIRARGMGPVWALGSSGEMRRMPIVRRVKQLNVWGDNDPSGEGQEAAEELGQRYAEAGREVTVRWPKEVGDYAG